MRAGRFEGIWWLPEDPGNEVSGTLEIDDATGGLLLRLIGSFKDLSGFNTPAEYPRVLGVVPRHLVTLGGLTETNAGLSSPGYLSQHLTPRNAFFDGHLSTPDPAVRSAWLKFTHMTGWLEPPSKTTEWENGHRSVTITAKAPPEVECPTPWGSVTFRTWEALSSEANVESVAHEANIRLAFSADLRYSEVERSVGAIQDLVTLAADSPSAMEEIKLEVAAESLEQQQGPFPYVDVTYDRVYQPPEPRKELHPSEFLFRMADLEDHVCESLSAWLRASVELDSALNLYFSTRYAERMFLETRFLNAAQAVEVLHRRRFPNEILPKADHRARIGEILGSVPDRHSAWLKGALSFSNEKPFAKRLAELLESQAPVMGPLVPDRARYIRNIVDVRNHFTHWTKKPKWVRPTNREIFLLSASLGVLFQACLLTELGLSAEATRDLFDRNKRYKWIAEQMRV